MRKLTKKENEIVIGSGMCSCLYDGNRRVNIFGVRSENECTISCKEIHPNQVGLDIITCKYTFVSAYGLGTSYHEDENKIDWKNC